MLLTERRMMNMTSIKPMLINEEPIMFEGEHLQFYFTQYVRNHFPCIICDSLESGPFATVTVNLDMTERFANSMFDAIDIAFSHNITGWNENFTELAKICSLKDQRGQSNMVTLHPLPVS